MCHLAKGLQADRASGQEWDGGAGKVGQRLGHLSQGCVRPARHGHGNCIILPFRCKDAINGQSHVPDTQFSQFTPGTFGFAKRRCLRAANQNDGRVRWIRETRHRRRIQGFLFLQASQRPQAGGAAGGRRDEFIPRASVASEVAACARSAPYRR